MSNENQTGLGDSAAEQSDSSELYSGSLEQPSGDEGKATEQPPAKAAQPSGESDSAGTSSGESEDSELGNLFEDLEKDIPEVLKSHALNAKKKMQGYFTKKNQAISQELETLKKNQVTDELKQSYQRLYGWYDRIQRDPKAGLKELASQLGVSPKALIDAAEAEEPQTAELTPEQLVTPEDYAAFARQETRKAIEELREKEVKPLQDKLSKFEGNAERQETVSVAVRALEDAVAKIPGFTNEVEGKKVLSENGKKALALVSSKENAATGEFQGPNAIRNAYYVVTGQTSMTAVEAERQKVKELEAKLVEMKANLAGATPPPGERKVATTSTHSRPENLWDDLSKEPLSPG